jgi:hypothetical protein
MKRIMIIVLSACTLALSPVAGKAQVHVSINVGSQPLWGPSGYDRAEYYYLPDLQMYYYVPSHQFIYQSNGRWVYANNLPPQYRGYDLYSGYKVVVNEPKPYMHFNNHRAEYGKYRGWKSRQEVIRDSRDPKYFVIKGHPGNANGHYKEHGDGGDNGNRDHGEGHGHEHGEGKRG